MLMNSLNRYDRVRDLTAVNAMRPFHITKAIKSIVICQESLIILSVAQRYQKSIKLKSFSMW